MDPSVKLMDLTNALDLPEEWGAWLDRTTGRVITLDPDTLAAADEDEAIPVTDDSELAVARAISGGDSRYLALPDKFDFHEYRHMERFIGTVTDARIADQLWNAIKGKGAFRHFKDTADRLGLLDDWYRYRDEAMNRFMLDWAKANQVTVDQTPRRPGPL
jgi:Uncharacterised protein family (UPF0158)